jgi:hypothetical protein
MTLVDWIGCGAVGLPAALCAMLVLLGAFDEQQP